MVWFSVDVNYLAVFLAAVASMIIGGLWYSPLLFGTLWTQLSGMTKQQIEEAKHKSMTKVYVLQFIVSLIIACTLAHVFALLAVTTLSYALETMFYLWLGFIATVMVGKVLWESRSWSLYLLDATYYLVSLLAMSLVLFFMS